MADLVSAVAAAVAAVAAVIALWYARQSVREGRQATVFNRQSLQAAESAMHVAEQSRMAAERDRERHHLQHIGELAERLHWVADEEDAANADVAFRRTMNLLAQAVAGREESLPECAQLLQAASAHYVKGSSSKAREEIKLRLHALEQGALSEGG